MRLHPSRWLGYFGIVVFALSFSWLTLGVVHAVGWGRGEFTTQVAMLGMFRGQYFLVAALTLFVGLAIRAARTEDPERRRRAWTDTLLLPCLLAPLAVVFPWCAVPSRLGIAFADFGFFLGWLTRYPTVGPINLEVALGTGAMLGASAMPAFFGAHATRVMEVGRRTALVALLLQLVAYVPVLCRLDFETCVTAWFIARNGPVSFFTLEADGMPLLGLALVGGPLMRFAATVAMFGSLVRSLRRPPASPR